MRRAVLLTFLTACAWLCAAQEYAPAASSTPVLARQGSNAGPFEPITTCNPGESAESYAEYPDESGSGGVYIGLNWVIAFDLRSPFTDPLPSFNIAFGRCPSNYMTLSECTFDPNLLVNNSPPLNGGNGQSGDFLFTFRSENTFDLAATQSPVFLFTYPLPDADYTNDGVLVGNLVAGDLSLGCNDGSFTSLSADNAVPAFRIYDCPSYTPGGCSFPMPPSDPLPTDPDVCTATFVVTEEEVMPNLGPAACPVTVSFDSDDFTFDLGMNTLIATITNDLQMSNSASCSQNFVVEDQQAPVLTCPERQTFEVQNRGECTYTGILPPVVVTENCAATEVTTPEYVPATLVSGANEFTSVATDEASPPLTDTCTFILDLETDTFAEFDDCPPEFSTFNDPGLCSALLDFPGATVIVDACTDVVVNGTPGDGSPFNYPVGTRTQAFRAITDAGVLTCSFDVIVEDNEQPTITCPEDLDVETTNPDGANVFFVLPTIDDNCRRGLQLSGSMGMSPVQPGDFFPIDDNLITYTVTDLSGNANTCQFVLSITQIPVSTTPSETPVFFPSATSTNSPSRNAPPSPGDGGAAPSPSESNTPTRSVNPSAPALSSASASASASVASSSGPSTSSRASVSPSNSRIVPSASRSRFVAVSPDRLSVTPSAYVPSASPSPTFVPGTIVYIQLSDEALLQFRATCARSTCNRREVEELVAQVSVALGISQSEVEVVSVFGSEVSLLICGSDQIATLANSINAGSAVGFEGVFVEDVNFDANCRNVRVGILQSGAAPQLAAMSALAGLFFALIF